MVVVIEDITDQEPATPEEQEQCEPSEAPEAWKDALEDHQEGEDWVKVDPADAVSPRAQQDVGLEDEQKEDEEEEIDPEEFAAQLAKADALKAEGNKFFADGNMDDAIDRYSQALEEAPMSAPLQRAVYFANRAACHMRGEEYAEAIIDCSACLELNPEYIKSFVRRATAFEAQHDYEAALVDLKKVLELEPSNAAAAAAVTRIEPLAEKKREEMKDEMIGKLKDLGNTVLGKFGMSLDSFKMEQDPATGSYSIKFQQ